MCEIQEIFKAVYPREVQRERLQREYLYTCVHGLKCEGIMGLTSEAAQHLRTRTHWSVSELFHMQHTHRSVKKKVPVFERLHILLKEPTWLSQKEEVIEQETQEGFVASYLRARSGREGSRTR